MTIDEIWKLFINHKHSGSLPDAVKIPKLEDALERAMPPGSSVDWWTATLPSGFLWADGALHDPKVYPRLFAVFGTAFGGDGTTTFGVPDCRGRASIGLDNLGGTSANRVTAAAADSIGGTGGAETHTLSIDEIPSHRHDNNQSTTACATGGTGVYAGVQTGISYTDYAGGDQAHNNMQPYIACCKIIKY